MRIVVHAICSIALLASTLSAAPTSMTYQGRLSDPGGNPVPDGNYNMTFRIYDAPAAGVVQYNSGALVVPTVDGLFSVQLSGVNKDDFNGDNRYLGITVGADPEITPRTQLITAPYAFRVETIDSASGGTITGDLLISGGTEVYAGASAFNHSLSTYSTSGVEVTRLWGPIWGQLLLRDLSGDLTVNLAANSSVGGTLTLSRDDGSHGVELDANDTQDGTIRLKRDDNVTGVYINSGSPSIAAKGGEIELMDQFGLTVINLNASTTADASVALPADAISSTEMWNEPGIASEFDFTSPTVNGSTTVALDSVEIDVPTAGYLLVTASGYIATNHVTGTDSGDRLFVSTIRAGSDFDNFAITVVDAAATSDTYYESFCITLTDQVGPGVTKYFLNANEFSGAGDFSTRHHLVMQFFPTSYGTVIETSPPAPGANANNSIDGIGTWKSNVRTITLEEHKAAVAAEVAKMRAELEATYEARLQKVERRQSQEANSQN